MPRKSMPAERLRRSWNLEALQVWLCILEDINKLAGLVCLVLLRFQSWPICAQTCPNSHRKKITQATKVVLSLYRKCFCVLQPKLVSLITLIVAGRTEAVSHQHCYSYAYSRDNSVPERHFWLGLGASSQIMVFCDWVSKRSLDTELGETW